MKMVKPEVEFIKFTGDIITTSGDTYKMGPNQYENTDAEAKTTTTYVGLTWNNQ